MVMEEVMKKVVFSANTGWYLYNFRLNTIKMFLEKGYQVSIIAGNDRYIDKFEKLGCDVYPIFIMSNSMNPYYDARTLLSLWLLYRKINPDFVYNFTPKINIYGTMALHKQSANVINNVAGLGNAFIERGIKSKILKILYKISQNRANKIFFQNDEDLRLFLASGIITADKCARLPGSGVDLTRFKKYISTDKENLKFVMVARLLVEKGVELYAEAAMKLREKYKNITFYLLGPIPLDNPSAVSLSKIKEWESNQVLVYLGETDDVPAAIKDFDCVVLPSYYREGVPKSLLEAGAMGKAIITTDNVGCRDTVIDKFSGFICEARSADSLAKKIEDFILLDESEIDIMKERSYEHIYENFDEKHVIKKYLETIQ